MDIKSFFGRFRRKADDDMIDSDPLDGYMKEPSSKLDFIRGLFRNKNNDADNNMESSFIGERKPEIDSGTKSSHLATNIALLCVLVIVVGIGAYIYHENGKEKQTQTASTFQPVGKPVKNKDAEAPVNPGDEKTAYGNVMINPFVDLGEMRKTANLEESAARRATLPPTIRSYDENEDGDSYAYTSIPAIPSFNPPSQPSQRVKRVGSIPAPLGGSHSNEASAPSGSVEVQGILMGNDGSSMAILSDGSVVETGDTYRDGRIAYIGGDGIKFDDGSSMQFKE